MNWYYGYTYFWMLNLGLTAIMIYILHRWGMLKAVFEKDLISVMHDNKEMITEMPVT